ncbi:NLI interacting factor-like phosphatase [Trifolium pratense]|uniref:Mitochondrial import inner membrane translocase subunit TIM50 n=1 Tax=Trifolium pratense TaxID=57577 RepID=A0A2K3NQK3_TRIPR|nr:NLI interacting factor-like phosphatase [Trifolium pratense]
MEAEKKSCSITIKDDRDDHKDSSEEQELSLSIEKLNLVVPKKKKLLVMNLNGFLLHRFIHRHILRDGRYVPNPILGSRRADSISGNFLLFKRPFSEEFMKFCLERFEVGIWSSAQEHNIDGALDLAIGEESKNKLLFVWNQDQCRQTNTASKESNEKPIYFKELQKVWEKVEKGGPYSASNTLMIGDKPYKAYLNPENTAIFAKSYDPEDKEDNALDPNGELCEYLKGVAEAEDVQSYVKNNEFGIPEITEDNSEWFFYFRVLFGELMV